jgi:hypothetical protein
VLVDGDDFDYLTFAHFVGPAHILSQINPPWAYLMILRLAFKEDLFGPESPFTSLKEIYNHVISLIIYHILIKVKDINLDISTHHLSVSVFFQRKIGEKRSRVQFKLGQDF